MAASQLPVAQPSIPYNRSSCATSKLITFEFTWTIESINLLCNDAIIGIPVMYSPTFIAPPDKITTEDKKPVEFHIRFFPMGDTIQTRDFVAVYLELKNRPGLDIMFVQSIVKANGEKDFALRVMKKFEDMNMIWGQNHTMRRDQLLDTANGYLSNDSLTLHCEVSIVVSEPAKPNLVELCDQLQSKYCPPEQLTKSMADLLESGSYADVTFVLLNDAGQEIRAHKLILMTRSRVFADMFESRMAESVTNRVEIVESREVFKQALHFIYTGKVEHTSLDAIAKDLLICADKYQLDPLKLICEEYLYSNITTESNLSDLLELANRHNAHKLQTKVLDLMRKNIEVQLLDADNLAHMNRFLSSLATDKED